jgi:hypothetical protein
MPESRYVLRDFGHDLAVLLDQMRSMCLTSDFRLRPQLAGYVRYAPKPSTVSQAQHVGDMSLRGLSDCHNSDAFR